MRALCLVSLFVSAIGHAQTWVRPDDTFGLNAGQIVRLRPEEFTKFFTAPERGGLDGAARAEGLYALALHERTQARLPYYSALDREFFDETRAQLADLAKTSVVQGMHFSGDIHNPDPKWSVAMQRSARLVNQAIWQMVRPRLAVEPTPHASAQLRALGERVITFGNERGQGPETGTGRVGYLIDNILTASAKRSARDQAILHNHMLEIGRLALLDDR